MPETDSKKLFENDVLEGQQAALSWITILKNRKLSHCFHQNLNPGEGFAMRKRMSKDWYRTPGLSAIAGKIQAIIGNARAYLQMERNGEPFADFVLVRISKSSPQVAQATTISEMPHLRPPPTPV
ncbi:DNA-3-methyladenine glycosylase I [Shigella flexneri]